MQCSRRVLFDLLESRLIPVSDLRDPIKRGTAGTRLQVDGWVSCTRGAELPADEASKALRRLVVVPERQEIQGAPRCRQAQEWPSLPLSNRYGSVYVVQLRHPANIVLANFINVTGMGAIPCASGNVMQEGVPVTCMVFARFERA